MEMTESGKILGTNVRYYPSQDHKAIVTRAVLVQGAIGDYAVYVGHGSTEWVAKLGNKLSFNEAVAQFPSLEKERYRS